MLEFLWWERESPKDDAKELGEVMPYSASRRKQPVAVSCFRYSDDAVLHEFATQQFRQVLRASMAASTYASKDGRIEELLTILLRDRMVARAVVDRGRFLQLIM